MNIRNIFRTRIIALLFLTSLTLVFSNCKKDNLEGTSLDETQNVALPAELQSSTLAASGITSSSYYLVNSLPSGYVKDGSRDYTSYVQAAVTKYSNIVFPGFPILVNDKGIVIESNKTITFQEGSEIRLKGTSNPGYNILKILNATNVTLYNPVVVGDRYTHIGTTGEYGMGIAILGSTDVTIYSPHVTNCWGDGIYLGQFYNKVNNKNIVIKDAYLRKNRRDGITINAVDGLLIDNIYAGYTDGTSPFCGINFEPDNALSELKNIRINNPRTEYNGSRGIQIGTRHMLTAGNKTSNITIVNHVDIGSKDNALKLSDRNLDGTTANLSGELNIINPSWQKTANNVPLNLSSTHPTYKITITSPEVINTSGSTLSYLQAYKLLNFQGTRANLTITETTSDYLTTPIGSITEPVITLPTTTSPTINAADIVFAVNAGGSSFKASNGITYSADKNYSGGVIYKNSNSIGNTSDDALYQSERMGNFSYSIPLSRGTYEITFKMAEIYHNAAGKRQFDIFGENVSIVTNLDIHKAAGKNNAYDIVKRITVNDGVLNLNFKTDIDNSKISAFHIKKD